jgi:DNA-binding response OmpR family regulator
MRSLPRVWATFDLVVSDVGLPDGTGIDFIKAYREHSNVPAIALDRFRHR